MPECIRVLESPIIKSHRNQPFPSQLLPLDTSVEDVLYVVDADLRVVFVNDAWRRFATSNNGGPYLESGTDINLLGSLSGSERVRWQAIYGALLAGQLPTHEENFICPSPIQARTYRLRIQPQLDADGKVAHLTHHAVRVDGTGITLEIIKRPGAGDTRHWIPADQANPSAPVGFKVLPRWWVVERVFGWPGRYRRHAKDYEEKPESGLASIHIAFISLLVQRFNSIMASS